MQGNPKDKKELHRFLGMTTYFVKFIPNLAKETHPLRKLLEKDVLWSFDQPQKEAMKRLKQLVTQTPILRYYDPELPIRISCDASTKGLGALLEQKYQENWYPVAYGSRSLNSSEYNYVPLEAEMLSIVFACEHFNHYIYGKQFVINNDHKPLQGIMNKPISKVSTRLQRFLLRLQKYNFEIKYVPGRLVTGVNHSL